MTDENGCVSITSSIVLKMEIKCGMKTKRSFYLSGILGWLLIQQAQAKQCLFSDTHTHQLPMNYNKNKPKNKFTQFNIFNRFQTQ